MLQNIGEGLKPKLIMTSTVDHFIYSMYSISYYTYKIIELVFGNSFTLMFTGVTISDITMRRIYISIIYIFGQ